MISMQDSTKHQGMRRQLIDTLRQKGIKNENVLTAMQEIPRHLFLDKAFLNQAYTDMAFKIGAGQTISQPFTVAYQTDLLEIQKGDKVLEIGTGSGYQTAMLMELGAKVFSIERQKELFEKAKTFLPSLGYIPKLFYGDGYKGLPAFAPFNKIIITCGAPFIPEALKAQLKIGGIMVVPLGEGDTQTMTILRKNSETEFTQKSLEKFRFVPMLPEKN